MQPKILFEINTSSGPPVFRQIVEQVHRAIASEQLLPGEILPSIREVAKQLVINPMTVSKAYSQLETAGYLTRKKGIGMLVNKPDDAHRSDKNSLLKPVLEELTKQAGQLNLGLDEVTTLLQQTWRENNE